VLLLRGCGDCVGASACWQRLVLWSCHAVMLGLLGVVLGPDLVERGQVPRPT
jgi:hypothetical protein